MQLLNGIEQALALFKTQGDLLKAQATAAAQQETRSAKQEEVLETLLERMDSPKTPARPNHPQATIVDNTGQKQTRSVLITPDTLGVSHRDKVRIYDPRSTTAITFPNGPSSLLHRMSR